jgi:hypothetical protein
VIFNDGGVLAGDPQFLWNKTTNLLTVTGSATITGDLTVDTNVLKVDTTNNRVGIGTASPTAGIKLDIVSTTSDNFVRFSDSVNATGYLGVQASNGTVYLHGNNNKVSLSCSTSNTTATEQLRITNPGVFEFLDGIGGTRMTLNSTGLGVGVSPSSKLDVNGNVIIRDTFNLTMGFGNQQRILAGGGSDNTFLTFSQWTGAAYTERMRIDQSGNVGIGVTPSAWLTAVKALDIGGQAMGIFSGGITHNAYFDNTDSRWEYKGNGAATYWNIQGGIHQWYVAASGIANNPITTFANAAMTLDASGNLLVGVTSANANGGVLQLKSGITFPATQVASADANTLDDYKESTWTPVITAGSGTPTTVTINSAVYTKLGRVVVCTFDFSIVNKGTASSSLQFGLPVTSITSTAFCGSFREDAITGNMGMVNYSTGTTAACLLYNNATPWVDGYRLKGTYIYFAA